MNTQRIVLLVLLGVASLSTEAQKLQESQFSKRGNNLVGVVTCTSVQLFSVSLSGALQNGRYTTIDLDPMVDEIESFKVLSKPSPQMNITAGFNGKRLTWTPLIDFKPDDLVELIVELVPKEGATLPSCSQFVIQLPVVRDQAPKRLLDNPEYTIVIDSAEPTRKKFNLVTSPLRPASGSDYENLDFFSNDDNKPVTVQIVSGAGGIFSVDTDNLLVFSRTGVLDASQTYEMEIKVTDHHGSRVGGTVIFKLEPNVSAEPIFQGVGDSGEFRVENRVYEEGEEIVIRPFRALVPSTGEYCIIEPVSYPFETIVVDDGEVHWTPQYTFLSDDKGDAVQEVRVTMVARSSAGVEKQCDLVIKVKNATSELTKMKYDEATEIFEEAQADFYTSVERALCLLNHSASLSTRDEIAIETIQEAHDKIETSVTAVSAGNPIVFAVYESIGVTATVLQGAKEKKAKLVAQRAEDLQTQIQKFSNLSKEYVEALETLGEFYTEDQADALVAVSNQLQEFTQGFRLKKSYYESIISIFSRRKGRELQFNCPHFSYSPMLIGWE